MATPTNHSDDQFERQLHMLDAARRATTAPPPQFRKLLDVVGAPVKRTGRMASGAVDIPSAMGATDAELARLNRRPARALAAQSHREPAWVLPAGMMLRR